MKRPALHNKRIGVLGMAFRDFRETGPRVFFTESAKELSVPFPFTADTYPRSTSPFSIRICKNPIFSLTDKRLNSLLQHSLLLFYEISISVIRTRMQHALTQIHSTVGFYVSSSEAGSLNSFEIFKPFLMTYCSYT